MERPGYSGAQSVLFVVVVIAIHLVFSGKNNRALVDIDPDIKDLGPADNFDPSIRIHPRAASETIT